MEPRFDLVVLGADGRVRLGVGVSAHTSGSSHSAARWAREVREAIFREVPPEDQPAFLLATPRAFFFWYAGITRTKRAQLGDLATYEWMTESDEILRPYFARAGVQAGKPVDPGVFEMIVWWWLGDVVAGIAKRHETLEKQRFYELVTGGRVEVRAAA